MDNAMLRLQAQSSRIALASLRAATGDPAAFPVMEQARMRAQESAARLAELAVAGPASYADAMRRWQTLGTHVDALRVERDRIAEAARATRALGARGPALQDAAEQLAAAMARSGAAAAELAAAHRLALLAQRVGQTSALLLASRQIDAELSASLRSDAEAIEDILRGLLEGGEPLRLTAQRNPEVRRQLTALQEGAGAHRRAAAILSMQMPSLSAAKAAASAAASSADALTDALDQLLSEPRGAIGLRRASTLLAGLLALIALAALVAIARQARARERSKALNVVRTGFGATDTGASSPHELGVSPSGDEAGSGQDFLAAAPLDRRRLARQVEDARDKVASAIQRAAQLSALAADAQRSMRDLERDAGAMTRALSAVEQISARVEALAQVSRPTVEAIAQASRGACQAIAHIDATPASARDFEQRIPRIAEYSKRMGAIAEQMADYTKRAHVVASHPALQGAPSESGADAMNALADEFERLANISAAAFDEIGALVHALEDGAGDFNASVEVIGRREKLMEDTERALAHSAEAAKQLGAAIDAMLEDTRIQHATLSALLEQRNGARRLVDFADQSELRSAELALELARVAAELERALASLASR